MLDSRAAQWRHVDAQIAHGVHSQQARVDARGPNFRIVLFGLGWVVGPGWVVPREVVSTAAAHASGRPPSVFLASPPSKACAMRSPASSEQRDRPSGLLCGRLLLALVESVLRPGGWENMCRLMCHCVRHIGLDNKHGRSVEAIHSFLSRWKAGTELCAGTQQEPCGKKSAMGSENRQRCSPRFRKSALMRSVPPRFDRAARKTRRALAAFLRL